MRTKKLQNLELPVLGMGTWCFGGRDLRNPENDDQGQIHALQEGIEQGFTLIDTAEYYAEGYAEELIAKAIAGKDRSKLFLTSKVWKTHLAYDQVIHAAEQSLRRLKTDYLDLYLYHQISEDVPLEETLRAMNDLVKRGLVRHIGVSNFAAERLKRAMAYSEAPIVMNQVHYNLKYRAAEQEVLKFCQAHDVFLQAWRPLRDLRECPLTVDVGEKYGLNFHQLALAWLLSQENVTAITAMKNPAHLSENLRAAEVILEPEDVERLRNGFPECVNSTTVPLR